jgi:hypothetical protein
MNRRRRVGVADAAEILVIFARIIPTKKREQRK